jgi:hypothetical protein
MEIMKLLIFVNFFGNLTSDEAIKLLQKKTNLISGEEIKLNIVLFI